MTPDVPILCSRCRRRAADAADRARIRWATLTAEQRRAAVAPAIAARKAAAAARRAATTKGGEGSCAATDAA